MALTDRQLLARYVNEDSQEAFAELVARHLELVYGTAARCVGSSALAEDVTQTVFMQLARKAATLSSEGSLAGWLHRHTRYSALDALRGERRRRTREEAAAAMAIHENPGGGEGWETMRPWIDEALDKIPLSDRRAIFSRFFDRRSFMELGALLGCGEEAARKRVERALEKLRERLSRRGITTTAGALAAGLAAHAGQTAPAHLLASVVAAVGNAGMASGGFLTVLTMANLKTLSLAALAAAGVTFAVIEHHALDDERSENRRLARKNQQIAVLQAENARLSRAVADAQAAKLAPDQLAELARLRGQVGLLKEHLRAALADEAAATNATMAASASTNNEAPPADLPYTAKFSTRVAQGEAFLTGGWQMSPGKRTFLLIHPDIQTGQSAEGSPDGTARVNVLMQARIFSVPDEMLPQFNLDEPRGRAGGLCKCPDDQYRRRNDSRKRPRVEDR